MRVVVRGVDVPQEQEEGTWLKKADVFCINNIEDKKRFEEIINDENVRVEKIHTQFTQDGKFYVAMFYYVKQEG